MLTRATIVANDFVKTGGMDRANYALADYLARWMPVELVSHRVGSELAGRAGVTFRRVPRPFGVDIAGEFLLDRAGRRAAKAQDPRAMIVNGGNCVVAAVNWVHYVHAAYRPNVSFGVRGVKQRLYALVSASRERAALTRAPLVIANSEATKRALVGLAGVDPARVRTVYYGIDPTLFAPIRGDEKEQARRELGLPARRFAAFVGGLGDRRKGFDTLFDAWHALCRDSAWELDLLVIGQGAQRAQFEARARARGLGSRLHFLGFRRDVPRVLAACDLLVAPTRYEAFGLGVLEALARGLPAVVSAAAGVAELYPAELESLLLADPDSASELVGRLKRWQQDSSAIEAQVQRLAGRVRSRTWDHMAADILELLQRLS